MDSEQHLTGSQCLSDLTAARLYLGSAASVNTRVHEVRAGVDFEFLRGESGWDAGVRVFGEFDRQAWPTSII
jgi:hypothetical protein